MNFDERRGRAQAQWQQGDAALAAGDAERAWRLYEEAHDLVTDDAELHRAAHQRLREANRRRGAWGEYLTDRAVLALAPFGFFRVLALGFKLRQRLQG